MLRVGFLFRGGEGWLGGVNYLWNLLYAIGAHEREALQPVLIASPGAALHGIDQLPSVEVVHADLGEERRGRQLGRILRARVGGRDATIEALCAASRLDLLSHSGTFGWRFSLPTLPWLADFQHRRLPDNFSATERALRVYVDAYQLFEGTATILSSEGARADCARFYPGLARRTEVLRFVSQPRLDPARLLSPRSLIETYALPERFLFLPNQFWRHKNHVVVVEALTILAGRGVRPVVVLTGKGADYRAPDHYAGLMRRVESAGLRDQFRHLGVVPFEHLAGLMRDALAVINPSLFEGWSTTVEEARSLGKATILSDIPVHREQDPPDAVYFAPNDAAALAAQIEAAWSGGSTDADRAREQRAAQALGARTAAFAARYRALVEAAMSARASSARG